MIYLTDENFDVMANEVKSLKEDVVEIKSDVKDIGKALQNLHLLIIGNYVTRQEFEGKFEKHEQEEKTSRRFWVGTIIAGCGLIFGITTYLFK